MITLEIKFELVEKHELEERSYVGSRSHGH